MIGGSGLVQVKFKEGSEVGMAGCRPDVRFTGGSGVISSPN